MIYTKNGLDLIDCPNCKKPMEIRCILTQPVKYQVHCSCGYVRNSFSIALLSKGVKVGKDLMGY